MQRQRLTNDDRRRIIDAYIAGHSVQQISLMFQFKRPAIYAVIRKYRTSQSIYSFFHAISTISHPISTDPYPISTTLNPISTIFHPISTIFQPISTKINI
ncbi:hypothetical protein ENBRE01_1478 [Enteropsectra breve]|nr:hypothetical protein ENBRE01_1478 [Enteropsectra breve]